MYNEKAQKLNDSIKALSTENILLKMRCKGLENAVLLDQKRRNRSKPLFSDLPSVEDGGAIFYSPNKVQRVRDLQAEKEEAAHQARIQRGR